MVLRKPRPPQFHAFSSETERWHYNALDCMITLELYRELQQQLAINKPCKETYNFALVKRYAFLEIQLNGQRVDLEAKAKALEETQQELARHTQLFNKLCLDTFGQVVNPNSAPQCATLLFDYLKCTGKRTTGKDNLKKQAEKNVYALPYITLLFRCRDLRKQASFLAKDFTAERFYSRVNIVETVTGRSSSSKSVFGLGQNSQNIDRRLRRMFISDEGYLLLNIDLEQADSRNTGARIYSILINTPNAVHAETYLKACESGDLHTAVAKLVWPHIKTKEQALEIFFGQDSYRQIAKKLGHGTNYNGKAPQMALRTGTPVHVIEKFQEAYFNAFPGIPLWHKWVEQQLRETRTLTTLFNRRRVFLKRLYVDADKKFFNKRTLDEALAFDPQSSTTHEIDLGLTKTWLKFRWLQILGQTHDSALFQIPEHLATDENLTAIKDSMTTTIKLENNRPFSVPVELKLGKNQAEYCEETNPNGLRKWTG